MANVAFFRGDIGVLLAENGGCCNADDFCIDNDAGEVDDFDFLDFARDDDTKNSSFRKGGVWCMADPLLLVLGGGGFAGVLSTGKSTTES